MLSSSIVAANNPNLEYIQIVSFGCGHDAVLSDEIIRIMKEISGKAPLILKVDESDAQGPLRIRVRSFIETIERKRRLHISHQIRELPDPYPVKYTKKEKKEKIVLIPNSSHAFCQIMTAAFRTQKVRAVPLEVGREEAIRLGKKYTHNDICFPAQIVIGEILGALESGKYDKNQVAVGMAKYLGCCRLPHYATILRKALDDAGYANVSIMTNDDVDLHQLHPGYKINMGTLINVTLALPMIDTLEEILRKIRPYELEKGSAEAAFNAFREDDKNYSGQGHRRIMLEKKFTRVGFGCVKVGDVVYWAQEFSSKAAGKASDKFSSKIVDATWKTLKAAKTKITTSAAELVLTEGETIDLPKVVLTSATGARNSLGKTKWSSANSNIAQINDSRLTAVQTGETEIMITVGDTTLKVRVQVGTASAAANTETIDEYTVPLGLGENEFFFVDEEDPGFEDIDETLDEDN